MNAPLKEIEVDLKEIGCPYGPLDERTLVWIAGYRKGHEVGMDRGAKCVSDAYDDVFAGHGLK